MSYMDLIFLVANEEHGHYSIVHMCSTLVLTKY